MRSRLARPAFTIVELLVVLGIIAVLVAVTVVVGSRVVESQKGATTADTIKILDSALATLTRSLDGEIPAPYVTFPENDPTVYPIIDGVIVQGAGNPIPVNTVGLFWLQAERDASGAKAVINQIPSKFVRKLDVDGAGPQPELTTVFDAWDRPIRYVHPAWDGKPGDDWDEELVPADVVGPPKNKTSALATVRRFAFGNIPTTGGDADGGIAPGQRPYFYSLGPDGKAGFRVTGGALQDDYNADNVYVTKPEFPRVP